MANKEMLKIQPHVKDMTDAEAGELVMHNFVQAQKDKRSDIQRCQRYRKIYLAQNQPNEIIDEKKGGLADDRRIYSNTYLPLGAAIVDTAGASIYNSFFSQPDYFEMIASDVRDDLASQRITAHLMKRHKEMKFRHTVYAALQMALTFDYAVTMTHWQLTPGFVPKRVVEEKYLKLGKIQKKYRDIRMDMEWRPDKIDRTNFTLFDFFNCYHDRGAKNGLEDSAFFVDVSYPLILDLYRESQAYGYYYNIQEAWDLWSDLALSTDTDDPVPRESLIKAGRIRKIRYWTHDHVVETIDAMPIGRQDIRGMPLQLWRIHRLPSQFEGMGMVQRVERLQYDINAIINLRRDFQNLSLNPVAIISEALADMNDDKIEIYPGRTFIGPEGPNQKDLVHFQQPGIDVSASSDKELALEVEMSHMVTGIPQQALGQTAGSRTTARETSAVAAGMLGKIFTISTRLEEECLEPSYQEMFLLEQANLTRRDQFKYFGQHGYEWVVVSPEDYKWSAMPTFMAKGTTLIRDREIHIQQFMLALDRALAYPQAHNLPNIFREMWKLLTPKDYQRFVKDPNERGYNIPPEMENIMMAMGRPVEINESNDHADHDRVHTQMINSADFRLWPPARQQAALDHREAHRRAAQMAEVQSATALLGGLNRPQLPLSLGDRSQGIRSAAEGAV